MDCWTQWALWFVGLLMDRWVEIAVGVVMIAIWRWFMGHKFKRQADEHKGQIEALTAAVAQLSSQRNPTFIVNVGNKGEHEPEREAVDRTRGDSEAIEINPGNGWRVARLILQASTLDEVEKLYRDFMSQPHKNREERVFAAYWVRACKLRGVSGQDCWQQTAVAAVAHERKSGNGEFWGRTIPEVGEIFRQVYEDDEGGN